MIAIDRTSDYRDCLRKLSTDPEQIQRVILQPLSGSSGERQSEIVKESTDILRGIENMQRLLKQSKVAQLQQIGKSKASRQQIISDVLVIDQQVNLFIKQSVARVSRLESQTQVLQSHHKLRSAHWTIVCQILTEQLAILSKQIIAEQEDRMSRDISHLGVSQNLQQDFYSMQQLNEDDQVAAEDDPAQQLSSKERQMLELENAEMLEDLLAMETQVQQTERTLLEISQLQTQLESHIGSQAEQINYLYTEAHQTTDTVKKGNVVLKKTLQYGVTWRNFVLLYFLVLSLTLLFLHWYY
ncbi:hypothetical protein MP228_009289 [Amoeboaphelidium protococcarum]|nr:hypothetical protein MP228_009289 [Amoeboaphelidium protococcarum]